MHYWFKPKRFWNWFAFYYPSNWKGWVTTLVLITIAVAVFICVDSRSHSVSDTLLNFAPWLLLLMLIFDLLCFRTGEYPSWWKKRKGRK